MDAPGNAFQSLRAMIHRVHGGHHGQQYLRRADIARGLLAADVLLARLEREPQGGAALRVLGDTDEAAGHVTLVRIAGGKEGCVRPAIPHRYAKTLRAANSDVRAEFAGWFQ